MAAVTIQGTGTSTIENWLDRRLTSSVPDRNREDGASAHAKLTSKTENLVDRLERGDDTKKDFSSKDGHFGVTRAEIEGNIIKRKNIASVVSKAIALVMAKHGSVKMATPLQLLRRELAQCHDTLARLGTEDDFLSIVVLVEFELGNKDWKQISKQELLALKTAIDIGSHEPHVTFDHYNRVLKTLNASGWTTGPTIEFEEREFSLPSIWDHEAEPSDE